MYAAKSLPLSRAGVVRDDEREYAVQVTGLAGVRTPSEATRVLT